jgi:hypothetical protein
LVGIYLGVYGVKVVNEKIIRMVTGIIILLCVLSRAIAIPMYLRQLGIIDLDPSYDAYFNMISKLFLFASGISGCLVILVNVARSYIQRRGIQKSLMVVNPDG